MISKLVAAAISPLGTALCLGALALWLAARQHRRWAMGLGLVALLWLAAWSTPTLSLWARAQVESAYPPVPVAQLPLAQAIVVLGGALRPAWGQRTLPDMGPSADRVWHAARLFHAGKAPWVLLSGGGPDGGPSEAEAMRSLLADLGVPAGVLLVEGQSRDTRQNAALSAALLRQRGLGKVLLVTSALHMPRARALFEAQGLVVVPAAIDHEALDAPPMWPWLPDTGSLDGSGRAFKEWVGRWVETTWRP